MDNNIMNEDRGMISSYDQIESLRMESSEWLDLMNELGSAGYEAPLKAITEKFTALSREWDHFCEETQSLSETYNSKIDLLKSSKKGNSKNKKNTEDVFGCLRILSGAKADWEQSILNMKRSISMQKSITKKISSFSEQHHCNIESTLASSDYNLKNTVPRKHSQNTKHERLKKIPPLPPSFNTSDENASIKDSFEWKKDSHADIKKALGILNRARLLSPSNQQLLLKLADAAKNPSNSFDFILQGAKKNKPELPLEDLLNCSSVECSIDYDKPLFEEDKARNSDCQSSASTRGTHNWRSYNAFGSYIHEM